ncbi:hypothetical protein [Herbiconiux sp. VKM Ac-2851]|uniref:hypothetical protein n=1 Tax=Herbiconiux sp. VKM Ac-2851 TaxID=2739025 RepID=UPI001564198D|nr:hypothetical protein [Herbiconiux sp. VKM Ac-2851]NQX35871.1 hypothetical protein [Herbiconiux sp. VKM Ac-2851]
MTPAPPPTDPKDTALARRTVLRAAAWSAPVVALGVATPLAAASTIDVGAYRVTDSCSVPGSGRPGFLLTAGPIASLPERTTITVSVTGVTTIGELTVTGVGAIVNDVSATSRLIVLTSPLPAGATMTISTTLSTSISTRWTLRAVSTLPRDYVATGATTESSFGSLSCRA